MIYCIQEGDALRIKDDLVRQTAQDITLYHAYPGDISQKRLIIRQ